MQNCKTDRIERGSDYFAWIEEIARSLLEQCRAKEMRYGDVVRAAECMKGMAEREAMDQVLGKRMGKPAESSIERMLPMTRRNSE